MKYRYGLTICLVATVFATLSCSDDTKITPDLPRPLDLPLKPPDKTTDGTPPVKCQLDTAAAKIMVGGIFSLTKGEMATSKGIAEQLDLIKSEVSKGCGTLGDATKGAAIDVAIKDTQDDATLTAGLATDLIQTSKAAVIVGAGGSGQSEKAGPVTVAANVPFAIYFGTSDTLSGCTAAQLADSTVTKSATPIYDQNGKSCWDNKGLVIRTTTTSSVQGKTAAKYVKETWPTFTKASVIWRNEGFGLPVQLNFKKSYEAAGGTVGVVLPYPPGADKTAFKPLIQQIVANDPEVVVGLWRIGELKAFMNAYAELSKDTTWTKPAGYDKIQFVHIGTLRNTFSDLSADAIAVMSARAIGMEPGYDSATDAFKKWLAAYQNFNPDGKIQSHLQTRVYDGVMLLVLAMTQANSTDGAKIKAEFAKVANGPGTPIYPGEFAKARALIKAGTAIQYQGATGPTVLTDVGNVKSTPYLVWGVNPDGTPKDIKLYSSTE